MKELVLSTISELKGDLEKCTTFEDVSDLGDLIEEVLAKNKTLILRDEEVYMRYCELSERAYELMDLFL